MAIGRIPENILEEILSRVDISELIAGYIPLKKAGRNFRALCPFHHEKTPSFMVSVDRQIYHCFGCGKGGNAFSFLMEYDRMEFPEAVEMLARKAGVNLPEKERPDAQALNLVTQLYKINELACDFYARNLNSSALEAAKNYFLKRGIKPETIKLFQLGYASQGWDALMSYLRSKGVSLGLLEKSGLILAKEGGGYYDRFRNRLIFPIFDIKSRSIAFGARVLDNSLPKYINSPETPIYTKGRNLYGMHLAKEAIRKLDQAVVVEGYLDFILPYQEGLENIVASLRTAFTQEQARMLKRYTQNVVIIYDGDNAGEIAALRSLDIFIEEEMQVKVVSLPQGFDPDLFVRKNGIQALQEKIALAQSLFDYKFKVLCSRYNPQEIEGKAKICNEMLPTLKKFKNAVLRSEYLKQLAQGLKIKEEALLEEMSKIKEERAYAARDPLASKGRLEINPTEKLLVKLMLEEQDFVNRIKGRLEPADFQDARISRMVAVIFELLDGGKTIEPSRLVNQLEDEEVLRLVCESSFLPEVSGENKEKMMEDCIQRLKNEKLKTQKQHLHEQIKNAQHSGNQERLQTLIQEFDSLIKKG